MPFTFNQRGMDEHGRRIRNIVHGLDNPDPLLNLVGFDLQEMWKANIDAGPNERWQAGPSRRVQRTGGVTLRDHGFMKQSIVGLQTGPNQVTVGSALAVGRGYNLLGLHEFGVNATVQVSGFTRRVRSRDTRGTGKSKALTGLGIAFVRPFTRHQFLPRRPTSPFDWDREQLLPAADAKVRTRIDEYTVSLSQ